jgi:O-methyltransferase
LPTASNPDPAIAATTPSPAHANFLQTWLARLAEYRSAHLIRKNTMATPDRLQSLTRLAQRLEDEQVPGDFVECGVYKGGTAALLARTATHSRLPRTLWLFDVFTGMPPSTAADGPQARGWVGNLKSSAPRVERLLRRTGADLSRVRIIPGLFQNTFPSVRIPQIALFNIDADWYESVKLCLDTFYDSVVPRGFISFDDYNAWPGCRLAVDEFFHSRGLTFPLHPVGEASWFQKL